MPRVPAFPPHPTELNADILPSVNLPQNPVLHLHPIEVIKLMDFIGIIGSEAIRSPSGRGLQSKNSSLSDK